MHIKTRKHVLFVLTLVFIFVSSLSASRLHFHQGRICVEERCSVCQQIESAKKSIQQCLSASATIFFSPLCALFVCLSLCVFLFLNPRSLITLKVRLNH